MEEPQQQHLEESSHSPRSPRSTSQTTSYSSTYGCLKTKWLLCPKCSKNIPTIVIFVKENIASVVIECQCGNSEIMSIEDYLNLKITKKPHSCDDCPEGNPPKEDALYCLNCMKWLCQDCITKHRLLESTKDHGYIKGEILMRNKCEVHTKNFNAAFCHTCDRGICGDCLYKDHKEHNHTNLNEMYDNLGMGIDYERFNEGINMVMKQKEKAKDLYIQIIDDYIKVLNGYKEQVVKEYENNKNKDNQIAELINTLFSNYEATSLYPNYNIIRNLQINACLNVTDYQSRESENLLQYTREIIQYYRHNYIINFNISTTYEKTGTIDQKQVTNLMLLPNHTFLSTSGKDLKLWDCKNYKLLTNFEGHTHQIPKIIKMPFDNQIASASIDKTIKIWNIVPPYNCLMTLTNHKSPVTNIGIMNNNKKLVSIALDGSVIIFDLPKYKASKTVSIEASIRNMVPVTPLHFAIDNGNILKLYDITNFSKLFILLGHSDDITSITRLNNGKVATGSKDKTIRIWDISSQEVEKTLKGSNDRVNKLVQFKDGILLSVCGNGSINMWDLETGTKLLVLNKNRLPMLTFMQLSDEIVISSTKERMYIWSVITGKCNNSIDYNFRLFC